MKKNNFKFILKFFLIIILCATTFSVRFFMLQKSNEPNGLDGYFYALQAKSFVERGYLENPSIAPGYYLCGLCSFFTKSPIIAVKIWSAISSTLVSLAIFLILFTSTKNFLISTTGFLLSAASPVFTVFSINYINNQTGIFFLLFFILSILKFLESLSKKYLIIGSIFFILASISHKVTMIYSFVFTIVIFLPTFIQFIKNQFKFFIKGQKAITLVLLFLFFALIFISALLFFNKHSPRFLNAFSMPSLPFLNHKKLCHEITLFGIFEISFYYFIMYIFAIILLLKKLKIHLILFVPVLFFPFLNLDSDMGIRLFSNAIPLTIPLFLYELNLLFNFIARKKIISIFGIIFCLILTCFMFYSPRIYNPKNDPPYKYYKKVVSSIHLEKDNLLIAHLGLNHVYTYYNDLKDALNWLPNFDIPIEKTWRLAYGVNSTYLKLFFDNRYSIENLPKNYSALLIPIDSNYTLLREDLWQFYLKNETPEIAQTYNNWYNPHKKRPDFIRKGKKFVPSKN